MTKFLIGSLDRVAGSTSLPQRKLLHMSDLPWLLAAGFALLALWSLRMTFRYWLQNQDLWTWIFELLDASDDPVPEVSWIYSEVVRLKAMHPERDAGWIAGRFNWLHAEKGKIRVTEEVVEAMVGETG